MRRVDVPRTWGQVHCRISEISQEMELLRIGRVPVTKLLYSLARMFELSRDQLDGQRQFFSVYG